MSAPASRAEVEEARRRYERAVRELARAEEAYDAVLGHPVASG